MYAAKFCWLSVVEHNQSGLSKSEFNSRSAVDIGILHDLGKTLESIPG